MTTEEMALRERLADVLKKWRHEMPEKVKLPAGALSDLLDRIMQELPK